jgi:hypothetical protein
MRNSPIPHAGTFVLPDGWAVETDSQVYSRSYSVTIVYDTPKYKGTICWHFNSCWGEFAKSFEWEGKTLYACNDDGDLDKRLGIPEDYCVRSGANGWHKMLTREMFEQWLRT